VSGLTASFCKTAISRKPLVINHPGNRSETSAIYELAKDRTILRSKTQQAFRLAELVSSELALREEQTFSVFA
jgi:hypothetical protein